MRQTAVGIPINTRKQAETYFPKAYVTIDDLDVRTPLSRYALSDISHAEVTTGRYPVDWRTFREVYSILFLALAGIWAAASSFGWNGLAGPALALFWLAVVAYAARGTIRKSYKYALVLNMPSGPIEATTSDDERSVREACRAINEIVKRHPPTAAPKQSGEPTRWMQPAPPQPGTNTKAL